MSPTTILPARSIWPVPGGSRLESAGNDVAIQIYIMQQLIAIADSFDQQWADSHMKELGEMASVYEQKGGDLGY